MTIIEIIALDNGAHRNQSGGNAIPDGWAVIPEGMETENFPFGEVEVETINGIPTVTKWIPGALPEPEPEVEPEPSVNDRIEAQVTYTAMMTGTLLEV